MAEPKEITRATYLQALGLFTMARRHMTKTEEFRKELGALLGLDDDGRMDGHLADAIYDGGRASFDEALKRDGITVAPEASS